MSQSQDIEIQYRDALYQKYEHCKKYMLPKDDYYATIADIKSVDQDNTSKSRHGYYILSK